MKKEYKCEKSLRFTICIVIVIFVILSVISSLLRIPACMYRNFGAPVPDLFSKEWFALVIGPAFFCVFVLWFGSGFLKGTTNFRKWKAYMIKNGSRYDGFVTGIEESVSYETDGGKHTSYRYRVSYIEPDSGDMKSFVTPVVNKVNFNITGATCDVYVSAKPSEWDSFIDRSDEMVRVESGKIQMSLNPFKLAKITFHNTSREGWLGDELAVNFVFPD